MSGLKAHFRCKEKTHDDYWMGRVTVQELTFSIPGSPPFTLTVSQHMLSQEEHTKELTQLGEWMVAALTLPSAEALAAENQRLRAALGGIEAEAIVQYMSASNQGSAAETIVRIARAALVNAELPGGQK